MMNKNENTHQLLIWGYDVLGVQHGSSNFKEKVLVQTPWSLVIKIEHGKDCYYLKQTPPDLYLEADIINVIQKNIPAALTPKVLFKNDELNSFLMNSCGDQSLRTKFNGKIDEKLLVKGLHSYINIQRALEQNLDDFLAIGVPDWRIKELPDLFIDLLENRDMLLDEGLSEDEIDQLIKLIPAIKSICQAFSEKKINETLVNCDFNENNMIINENSKQISIIDWGESVISHPFFSIATHLQSLARRYRLDINGALLGSIKQQCLSSWLDVADKNELNEIYQLIVKIHPIYSALSIHRLQMATHNASKNEQRWFIAGSLQALLRKE